MPSPPVTIDHLFEHFRQRLELEWLAGRAGAQRPVVPTGASPADTSLIGHLNFIHPHRIQVLGNSEFEYLERLGKNSFDDALDSLFSPESSAVVVTDGHGVPAEMLQQAERRGVPLFASRLAADRLIDYASYYLTGMLADKLVVHGVFLEVMGIGVLLTGDSAVGKSELALELITRGHRLVADDAPEFIRTAPDTLHGRCPELLRDFLEVRGLGLLNVRAMFGDSAIKRGKTLRLIINLTPMEQSVPGSGDRLHGSRHTRNLLDVEVPEIHLPVAPGRNLAVLVEAAARNQILYYNGYSAADDFIERQRQQLKTDER